jgi:hypothetical protein
MLLAKGSSAEFGKGFFNCVKSNSATTKALPLIVKANIKNQFKEVFIVINIQPEPSTDN